jgi:potassium-transporting ATPase KdpC subunit
MRDLKRAFFLFALLSVVTGLVYPFAVTGLSRLFFPYKANGSLITVGGRTIGSVLIGQEFTSARYFHGRPSANGYDATNSGATNFGPSNGKFLGEAADRVAAVRVENGIQPAEAIPSDLVLASASGLDPEISIDGALLQVKRVARARDVEEKQVQSAVRAIACGPYWGGQARVNVLELNLALDGLRPAKSTGK